MLNTPKSVPRLSYTQSHSNFSIKSSMTEPRIKHNSLQKTERINYNMILNKMLSIDNFHRFLSLASKYVDRLILQCKQQPNRHSRTKDISNYLISDGKFIRKLAQLSQNPLIVLNHFKNHIRTNKRLVKELYDTLLNQLNQKQYGQPQRQIQNAINQTQQERENRLNGYCKPEQKNEVTKQIKIDYSQYIKSNRKSMQIYQKMKKKVQEQENKNVQKQQLKRTSLRVKNQTQNGMQQLTINRIKQLSQTEQQILKYFPQIKYRISKKSDNLQKYHKIERVGVYKGYQIYKVAIQLNYRHYNPMDITINQSETTIEHAITVQRIVGQQKQNMEPHQNKLNSDLYIRIYLTQ